jgi:hypothetical protein
LTHNLTIPPGENLTVLPHAVAVAANRHEMTVVNKSVGQRRRHDIVTEDDAPLFEALFDVSTVDAGS